jgi:hypothetical protein
MGDRELKIIFAVSALLYFGGCRQDKYSYKQVTATLPATHTEPLQTPADPGVSIEPCCRGPYCWKFEPLFAYDVRGVVFGVSHKFSSRLADVMAADLGMVWGENAAKERYRKVKFRTMLNYSEVFWRDGVEFNLAEFGNTHVVTCDKAAFRAVKAIKTGDQARLRGWLVKAEIMAEPGETDPAKIMRLQSSVSRKDKGEGACEVLYVKSAADVEILKAGPRLWLWLERLGLLGMAACAVLFVLAWRKKIKRDLAETERADF